MDLLWRFEQSLPGNGAPPRRGNSGSNGLSPQTAYDYFNLWYEFLSPQMTHEFYSPHTAYELFIPQTVYEFLAGIPFSGQPSLWTLLELQQLWGPRSNSPVANEQQERLLRSSAVNIVPYTREQRRAEGSGSRTVHKALAVLPEEIVEKIVSSLPFPDLMQARILNTSWASKFTDGLNAKSFQDQVNAVSGNWQHYCPVILNIAKEWLIGYDRQGNRWHKMNVAFARDMMSQWFSLRFLRGAGALMCGVVEYEVFVINIVLRTCVWLPRRPHMEFPHEVHLLPIGSYAYRLLLISKGQEVPTQVCCQIYDSQTKSWFVLKSTVNSNLKYVSMAYMDSVLYSLVNDNQGYPNELQLLSYNMETGTWATIPHPFEDIMHRIDTYELFVSRSQVMIVIHLHSGYRGRDPTCTTIKKTVQVYTLNTVTLEITLLTCGPSETLYEPNFLFANDNECIYFGNPQVAWSSVVELDLRTHEWLSFSFAPGLNPFVQL